MAGISGRVAQSARLGFEDAREQRQLAEEIARRQQQQEIENAVRLRKIVSDEQQHRDLLGFRESEAKRGAEQFERTRRDRANEVGLEQMGRDRKVFEEEKGERDLEAALADPSTPPALKKIIGLRKIGISASPSAEMLLSPEERAAAEESDLKRIEKIADVQARTAARYRAPKEQSFEKVETVDDKGNPIIKYMTPEEVRAQGGVRGVPKTTAKAQGPATVDAILGEIEGLSNRINTGSAGPLTKLGGLARRGAGAMNLDDDVAEYESLIAGFTPIVARAVGHTGVLTEQDVQSVRALFPRPGDSQTLANNKLKRVRALMAKIQPEGAMSSEAAPATPQLQAEPTAPSGGGAMPAFRFNPKTGKLEPVK